MHTVSLGYGEYKGFHLNQLPEDILQQLAQRYQLKLQGAPDHESLLITVAVHGELQRRSQGGKQEQKLPSLMELGSEIINKGYQQASKRHHPDMNGKHETHLLLSRARDFLQSACRNFVEDEEDQHHTSISAVSEGRTRKKPPGRRPLEDDDLPF